MPPFHRNTAADYLDAAHEMADTGHPVLARLLAEEAADRVSDPAQAARILSGFPELEPQQEED